MNIPSIIEAVLFVAGEPIEVGELARALDITEIEIEEHLEQLRLYYKNGKRGIRLMRLNDAVQLKTNEEYAKYIQAIFRPPQQYALTQSALETLSIIAYRQPVTRAEVEAIRGVKSDYSMSVLQEKRLIQAVGKKDTIGRPNLYGTTDEFLRHFGISSLAELPSLEELNDVTGEQEENAPSDQQ
ncbi:SMC-Scp complex subunit ScpB [Clostridia bacterium OttesenSCG-928-F22]|nr:SMC-Scp complex subunit ScpB [Clostridia bacterium OttesenSCG-928-F22]